MKIHDDYNAFINFDLYYNFYGFDFEMVLLLNRKILNGNMNIYIRFPHSHICQF